MSGSSWEEIKRLASDFKQAQLSSTFQRISERNCVEVVTHLINMGLVEVYHTSDGKSYVTPDMVVKEIYDEIILHNGRVNLVDLQQAISISFSHIESKVQDIMRNDSSLHLVLGQLITKDYLSNVCREVNDLLHEQGLLQLSDIIKQYDLPTEFLRKEVVEVGLESGIIQATIEGDSLYTEAYIARRKAQIQGYLSAVVRPISLSNVQQQLKIPSKLFNTLMDNLISNGRIKGSLASGHATFVPECYSKMQTKWLDNFFSQNGYIEFSSLKRIANVANPRQLVSKTFPKAVILNTCAVDAGVMNQLQSSVDEAVRADSWLDVSAHLPVCADSSDRHTASQTFMKRHPSGHMMGDGVFVSPGCLERCRSLFDPLMNEQAVKDIRERPASIISSLGASGGTSDQTKEDESKSKSGKHKGGKSGGGFQGREIKSKNVKKKYLAGKGPTQEAGDVDMIPFMSEDEIKEVLSPALGEDAPEELVQEIAETLHPVLLRAYQEVIKSVFVQTSGTAMKRSSHGATQDKLMRMSQHLALADKSYNVFCSESDKQLRESLNRHLMKTLGNDIVNEICTFIADDYNYENWPKGESSVSITSEMRTKLINNVSDDKVKVELRRICSSVQKTDISDFQSDIDRMAGEIGMMVKRADKKKEKQLIAEIAAQLSSDLDSMESNPPLLLLSTCCLLFQGVAGLPLNVPGRNVPNVISWLKGKISPDTHADLNTYQDLVVKKIKQSNDESNQDTELLSQLERLAPKIKAYASDWKHVKVVESK